MLCHTMAPLGSATSDLGNHVLTEPVKGEEGGLLEHLMAVTGAGEIFYKLLPAQTYVSPLKPFTITKRTRRPSSSVLF